MCYRFIKFQSTGVCVAVSQSTGVCVSVSQFVLHVGVCVCVAG